MILILTRKRTIGQKRKKLGFSFRLDNLIFVIYEIIYARDNNR